MGRVKEWVRVVSTTKLPTSLPANTLQEACAHAIPQLHPLVLPAPLEKEREGRDRGSRCGEPAPGVGTRQRGQNTTKIKLAVLYLSS